MSEENMDVADQQIEAPAEQVEYNEVEQQALKQGWKPPTAAAESGLDQSEIVDAKTFLDRGPFIKQIKKLEQRNISMSKKIDAMFSRWNEAESKGYERAIDDLKYQRDQAFDELDSRKVRQLDDEILKNEKAKQTFEQQAQLESNANHPALTAFIEDNKALLQTNKRALAFAQSAETAIKADNPYIDPYDLYTEIQQQLHTFLGSTPKKSAESFVTAPTRGGAVASKSSYAFHDLRDDVKDVYMSMKNYHKNEFGREFTVADFVKAQVDTGIVSMSELVRK